MSLYGRLQAMAARSPESAALLSPGRPDISYRTLLDQIQSTWVSLHAMGIGRKDRVAIALPDSLESAVMIVATLTYATSVPMDPRYTASELAQHIRSRGPRVVVAPKGGQSAAHQAAAELGLSVIELLPTGGDVLFELKGAALDPPPVDPPGEGSPDEIAMVLQTSGTTGSPKVVPLTRRIMEWVAAASTKVMELTERDRCLSIVPMFHMTGLGTLLYPLLTGGSCVVTGGFSQEKFFDWMEQFRPTWYSAVPAIHQAILQQAPKHQAIVTKIAEQRSLRFIRSIAAAMPSAVPAQLEKLFNSVYLEGAGSTEASLTNSNRMDRRRAGSIGPAIPEVEIRVLDGQGNPVGPGVEGEMIIRSPGVFAGYENNPQANAAAFIDGFYRTGDLGRYDEDGFFYITGRVREQINRGGSKVSPPEVDDVLRQHPSVAEAVTFAMPHDRLGEEVAAAILLREGAMVSELELQRFAAEHLADYKVPRRIAFVSEIIRGQTGKPLRIGLAEKLGLSANAADDEALTPEQARSVEPQTPAEQALAAVWSEALSEPVVDIDKAFTALGGDSLQALQVTVGIEKQFGRRLPLAALFSYPTIRTLAGLLQTDGWKPTPGAPVVLREGARVRPALFVLPGILGNVYHYYTLASHLPISQRVVGLPLPGADGLEQPLTSFDAVADRYAEQIRADQPDGPYFVCGYSIGGRLAYEVARRLVTQGQQVAMLGMLDTPAPGWPPPLPLPRRAAMHLRRMREVGVLEVLRAAILRRRGSDEALLDDALDHAGGADAAAKAPAWQEPLLEAYRLAARNWSPQPISLPIHLFRAAVTVWTDCDVSDPAMGWSKLTSGGVTVATVPGSHGSLFHEPNVTALAASVASAIQSQSEQ